MSGSMDHSQVWRSSSTCADGACVQVAMSGDEVLVRNSRQPSVITRHSRAEWDEFLAGVVRGEFRSRG